MYTNECQDVDLYEKVPCWWVTILKYILFCWFLIPMTILIFFFIGCFLLVYVIGLLFNGDRYDIATSFSDLIFILKGMWKPTLVRKLITQPKG